MSNLEEMTKAELLDYAREIGASPANNDMTKEELRESIERKEGRATAQPEEQAGGEEAPELTVTTLRTKDFVNRALINATPGTSQATDYLGRSVVTGDKDFLGRSLVP